MSACRVEVGHEVFEFLSSEPNTPSDAEGVDLASIRQLVDHRSADPEQRRGVFHAHEQRARFSVIIVDRVRQRSRSIAHDTQRVLAGVSWVKKVGLRT